MKTIVFPNELTERSEMIKLIAKMFSDAYLEKTARQTKMIQRSTSKLSGKMFLTLNALFIDSLSNTSLEDQCELLWEEFGVEMTKQSLDERYNTDAVGFMKTVFGNILRKVIVKPENFEGISRIFKRIFIEDATSFQLPQQFAPFYASAGGDTTGSSIKIDFVLELISGSFKEVTISDGKTNDAKFLRDKPLEILPDDLVLRDLGYLKNAEFSRIASAGGFFITRYKTGTTLYQQRADKVFEPIAIKTLLGTIHYRQSVALYYGKDKLPVRVVIDPLTQDAAEHRLKKLKAKAAKNKNWKLSEERLQLCRFNIFMCNFEKGITEEQVLLLYSLRWQIELMFKIWKSIYKIDKVSHTNIFRFECFLYGKLIALCLSQQIISMFRKHLLDYDFELSEQKAFKQLKKNFQN